MNPFLTQVVIQTVVNSKKNVPSSGKDQQEFSKFRMAKAYREF